MTLALAFYLALSPGFARPATIKEIANIGVAPIFYDAYWLNHEISQNLCGVS